MGWFALSPPDDGLSTVTVEYVPHIINDLQPTYTLNPLTVWYRFSLKSS